MNGAANGCDGQRVKKKRHKRFSQDDRIKLVNFSEFFDENPDFSCPRESDMWHPFDIPEELSSFLHVTERYFIGLRFDGNLLYYGRNEVGRLEKMFVAERDGTTEYDFFQGYIDYLEQMLEKGEEPEYRKVQTGMVKSLRSFLARIPPYQAPVKIEASKAKSFDTCLKQTDCICKKNDLHGKYLVLNVETNGTSKSKDDLLGLSILNPDTGVIYNRFFPLDQQPIVLTSWRNGIIEDDLRDAAHLTQGEFDEIVDYFEMGKRTVLIYNGMPTFDIDFLKRYFKRHGLIGADDIKFQNIKCMLPDVPFDYLKCPPIQALCLRFGIGEVSKSEKLETSCILEWRLFEHLWSHYYFLRGRDLCLYSPDYVIPYYLLSDGSLRRVAGVMSVNVTATAEEIYLFNVSKKQLLSLHERASDSVDAFPVEEMYFPEEMVDALREALDPEIIDQTAFFERNEAKLKPVYTFEKIEGGRMLGESEPETAESKEIDIPPTKDVALLCPLVASFSSFLKNSLFENERVKEHEISISSDGKVYAECDLSSSKLVLGAYRKSRLGEGNELDIETTKKLYYQANGREAYLIVASGGLLAETKDNVSLYRYDDDGYSLSLCRVKFDLFDPEEKVWRFVLDGCYLAALEEVVKNPDVTIKELTVLLKMCKRNVAHVLYVLNQLRYIERDNPKWRASGWKVLRGPEIKHIDYTFKDGVVQIVSEKE